MFLVTVPFLGFLAVSLAAYYLSPLRIRWIVLLAVSIAFYCIADRPITMIYLLVTILTIWAGSNFFESHRNQPERCRRVLILTIICNAGILAALKYTNFVLNNTGRILRLFGQEAGLPAVHWAASMGVSFYTLQALGYLLDVYWETSHAQKNPAKLALFISWFPQMSSGPISRYQQLGEELYQPHRFHYDHFCRGLWRMLLGFIKKLVLAEHLAVYVNPIFEDTAAYGGWFIWLGMAVYLLQLYADFSGCMDIVLGAASCFGVRMPENFDRPFHSRSIQEFWKRWHMTLGAWVQDYILFPILHSRKWGDLRRFLKKKFGKYASKNVPTYLAMLILWLFMGLWHGGDWRYITEMVWFWLVIMTGQILERPLKRLMNKISINPDSRWWHRFQSVRTTLVFGIGVTFFRASSVRRGLRYLKSAFTPSHLNPAFFREQLSVYAANFDSIEVRKSLICISFGLVVMGAMVLLAKSGKNLPDWLGQKPLVLRWILLYILLFGVLFFGMYGPGFDAAAFIYGMF